MSRSSLYRIKRSLRHGSSEMNDHKKSQPYHHGNLRESLLDAADQLLATRGLAGLSLREVAKQAGVSHAAPYHHFASLDDILAAISERGFTVLSEAVEKAAKVSDTHQRLEAIAGAYVNTALAHPSRFKLMFSPLLRRKTEFPGLASAADRSFAGLRDAAMAHDPQAGDELALLGWSLVHGMSHLLIDGLLDGPAEPRLDPGQLARQLTARLLTGAGTAPRYPASPADARR